MFSYFSEPAHDALYRRDYIATITGYKDDNSLKACKQPSVFRTFLLPPPTPSHSPSLAGEGALEQIANLTHSPRHRIGKFGIGILS